MTRIQRVHNVERGANSYTSGAAITEGDLVRIDGATGKVVVSVTSASNLNLGIARNTVAAADLPVLVDEITAGDELLFPVEAGTAAFASQGDFADLNSPDGITLTVTNSDVIIKKFINATTVTGHVRRCVRG